MHVFGESRSRVARNHALIAPDSHVVASLPGWKNTDGVTLITPQMGARFSQYLALMEAGSYVDSAPAGIERLVYVVDGTIRTEVSNSKQTLEAGGFAWLPPDLNHHLEATRPTQLVVFDKHYAALPHINAPPPLLGRAEDRPGEPFLGDPDAVLQTLLPTDERFDMAVNIFTFQPGATLPMVEVHVMEHGLLMLAGMGVYRLGDRWYPVRAGDVIWMASYCPQWFVAMGREPAAYLYYKDVNRHPLTMSSERDE